MIAVLDLIAEDHKFITEIAIIKTYAACRTSSEGQCTRLGVDDHSLHVNEQVLFSVILLNEAVS